MNDNLKKLSSDCGALNLYLHAHPPADAHLNTLLVGVINALLDFAHSVPKKQCQCR